MIARFGVDLELGRNARPALMTIAGVLMFSFMPLAIAIWGRESPFLFVFLWRIGLGVGLGIFLALRYKDLFLSARSWRLAMRRDRLWMIGLIVVGMLDIPIFTFASTFVDISVATIIYELNPLALVFFMAWLFRREGRYRKISMMTVLSFWLALIGVGLVVMAQGGGLGSAREIDLGFTSALLGALLAICSAAVVAFSAYSYRWGMHYSRDVGDASRSRTDMEFFGIIMGVFIANAVSAPVMALCGVVTGEIAAAASGALNGVSVIEMTLVGVSLGIVVHACSTLLRYLALHTTTNLGINVIRYLLPLFALLWLFIADGLGGGALVGEIDVLTLLLGMAVILAANMGVFIDDSQHEKDEAFAPLKPADVVMGGETEWVEFKSRLWESRPESKRGGRFNSRVRDAMVRSVCGMLNGGGGVVAIGVADDGEVFGIGGEDVISADKHTLYIMNVIKGKLGSAAARRVRVEYARYRGRRLCFVRVARGRDPLFMDENGRERFYLRSGPQVSSLSMSEAAEYIKERF